MNEEDKSMAGVSDTSDASADASGERDYLDGFLSGDTSSANADQANADQASADQANADQKSADQNSQLRDRVIASIREIFDPEIPVNIFDLGLIYEVEASNTGEVIVTMTLTTPHCPVAESMPSDVEVQVRGVEGVTSSCVNLVWDPPWDPSRMTEEAQLELGFI